MKFRELPDLELAALAGALFELTFLAGAIGCCPEAFAAAGRSVVAEILARRADPDARNDLLFRDRYPVPLSCRADFMCLANHAAAMLKARRFPAAAAFLSDRIGTELEIDASAQVTFPAGVELRTLN